LLPTLISRNIKKIIFQILFLGYLIGIYFIFWETADDVMEIKRLRHYEGVIVSLRCSEKQVKRGGIRTNLEVLLGTQKHLIFRLPQKKCDEFFDLVPKPQRAFFNAYFTAGSIMSLYIDRREIVNFEEQKSYSQMIAMQCWFFPVVLYVLYVLHRKWYKKRNGVYPEEYPKNPYW
jgi:hypothetical protein